MAIDKIEFAKKLIKFNKRVEATPIIHKIINDVNSSESRICEALELLIFSIELDREPQNIQWERIFPFVLLAQSLSSFSQEKLQQYETFKSLHYAQYPDVHIELSTDLRQWVDYFQHTFMDLRCKQNIEHMDTDFEILLNVESAAKTAWNQNIQAPFESWNDLRSQTMGEIYRYIFQHKIKKNEIDLTLDQVNQSIETKIFDQNFVYGYFYDDVIADIQMILYATFISYTNPLIEKMKFCYKNHYLPCGWKGDYPAGKLCVIQGDQSYK